MGVAGALLLLLAAVITSAVFRDLDDRSDKEKKRDKGRDSIRDSELVRASMSRVLDAVKNIKDKASAADAEKLLIAERQALRALLPLPAEESDLAVGLRTSQMLYLILMRELLDAEMSLLNRAMAGKIPGLETSNNKLNEPLARVLGRIELYRKEADRVMGPAKKEDKPGK